MRRTSRKPDAAAETFGHPLSFPGDAWTCPDTGLVIQKDLLKNLAQRREIIAKCDASRETRLAVLEACRRSPKVWINLFGWTYVIIDQTAGGRRNSTAPARQPFVTWPVQDALIDAINDAQRSGASICITKSREMGASWVELALDMHACLFIKHSNILIGSRKEDAVDDGSPDSLFWKLDFLYENLPAWMQPSRERIRLAMGFPGLGTRIDGESCNADFGRGGRRTKIAIDEAAAVDILRQIDNSTSDTTVCRVFVSTPKTGSYFGKLVRSGKWRVFRMHWFDHPGKGVGRTLIKDPDTGEMKFTAPWYRAEVASRVDPQNIAENLDVDDEGGSGSVFDNRTLNTQRVTYAKKPTLTGDVALPKGARFDPDTPPEDRPVHLAEFKEGLRGRLRWWGELIEQNGIMRPPPRPVAVGVDVSMGVGGSDSVAVFVDAETGWMLGRWSSNMVMPGDFADTLYLIGSWIAGPRRELPYLCLEINGPGRATLMRLQRLGYSNLHNVVDTSKPGRPVVSYGWTSTRPAKRAMLESFRTALARAEFKCTDAEILEQAAGYVHYEDGGVGPIDSAGLTEEQAGQHGDMVIAGMLAHHAAVHIPAEDLVEPEPIYGSFGDRAKRRKKRRLRRDDPVGADLDTDDD